MRTFEGALIKFLPLYLKLLMCLEKNASQMFEMNSFMHSSSYRFRWELVMYYTAHSIANIMVMVSVRLNEIS